MSNRWVIHLVVKGDTPGTQRVIQRPGRSTRAETEELALKWFWETDGAIQWIVSPDNTVEPKQKGRNHKIVCPKCGYPVRTSLKWIRVGLPTCPCGTQMELEG